MLLALHNSPLISRISVQIILKVYFFQFVITINEKDDEKPWLDKTQYSHCAPEGSSLSSFAASAIDNDVLARHKDLEYELLPSSLAGVDSDGTVTVGDVSGYSSTSTFSRHILRVSGMLSNVDFR